MHFLNFGENIIVVVVLLSLFCFVFLQVKTFAGLEAVELCFLIISAINVLVVIGLTINRLVELKKDTPDYTFAIILFFNIGN